MFLFTLFFLTSKTSFEARDLNSSQGIKKDRSATEQAEILIVDDRPDNLRLLSQILVRQDYQVRKAIKSEFVSRNERCLQLI